MRQARERIERLEQAMREAVADWTLAPVVEALQAMRGMDMIGARELSGFLWAINREIAQALAAPARQSARA